MHKNLRELSARSECITSKTLFNGFTSGSAVKTLPAMQEPQETRVRSLGQGDLLEKGMATHSRIFAWRTPLTEEPGGLQSIGSQKSDTTEAT